MLYLLEYVYLYLHLYFLLSFCKAELEGVYMLRKFLAGGGAAEVTEQVVPMMAKTATNEEFLAKLKDWIKIYEHQGYTLSSR